MKFENTQEQRYAAVQAIRDVLRPPPNLTVSEWADAFRMLSAESSAEPGRWSTDRAPYQREIMDTYNDPDITDVCWVASAQVGKALDIDTPIPTPTGWRTMGDLAVGDTVFGAAGQPVRVVFTSQVMYGRDCYEVVFSDGTAIVADADHLWTAQSDTDGEVTRTTREIADTLKYGSKGNRNRYAIPMAGAIRLPEADLPLDPYVLGAWLGDGHARAARIYSSADDALFMREQIEGAGHEVEQFTDGCEVLRIDPLRSHICARGHDKRVTGWSGKHGCAECSRINARNYGRRSRGRDDLDPLPPIVQTMPRRLSALDLIGNKHIPAEYLRASIEQRTALLQGLMDTDGYIDHRGRCEFVTTSAAIAEGFAELLHSLGIKHTVADRQPTTRYKGKLVNGAPAKRFSFLVYDDMPVFRLPRKRALQPGRAGRRVTETLRRRIVEVRSVATRPVRCIQVDADDSLYLAGHSFQITHNTEVLNNIMGYAIDMVGGPMMHLQPTIDMAQAWSKDRLAPMARDTPRLRKKIKMNARDGENTILHKKGPGFSLVISGSNSPASLASRPIRDLLADEIDRYDTSAGREGDPLNLARKRTNNFWNRKRYTTSTPTILGASRIMDEWEMSDKREYFVPCPHCGHMHTLQWANVQWPKDVDEDGLTLKHRWAEAYMVCPDCGGVIEDRHKGQMLAGGKWIAQEEFHGRAGFRINELYSPWRRFSNVVQDFLDAKGNPETLKVWTNTSLGEPFEEDAGEKADPELLLQRMEEYPAEVPEGAHLLVAGVDVQNDRIEIQVDAYAGDGSEECWLADYEIIYGDPANPDIWDQLEGVLSQRYKHENGIELPILAACIDSGAHTQMVYEFCSTRSARRIFAVKGMAGEGRPFVAEAKQRKRGQRKTPLFILGVDDGKATIMSRLAITKDGPGYRHYPAGHKNVNIEYFKQLTAEKRVKRFRFGKPYFIWMATRPRNEALDTTLYALAAYRMLPRSVIENAMKAVLQPHAEPPKRKVQRTRGSFQT